MRIRETKVFTFMELTEEAKQFAIEQWRNSETYDFIGFDYYDYYSTTLEENGFNVKTEEFRYSLCNCQGDGVSYLCKDFNEALLIENFLKENKKYNRIVKIIERFSDMEFAIVKHNYSYVHEKSVHFECSITPLNHNYLDIAIDDFCDEFTDYVEDIRLNLCLKFETVLQGEIDYLLSEESITENIEINEYEFTIDGKMI